ncbi:MAG: hypothetical protein D6753_06225 [Planctomycetota bacterium]|nr:MAG: hypothetical protein D6753_06225 [Planctomycetota bacterium]
MWTLWASLTGVACMTGPADAQIECDRVYPVCVPAGLSTEINAEGKFGTWPVQVWCDRSDVRIACAETKGKLSLTVAPDAPPGVAWVRLADAQSASRLFALRIARTPVVVESEPNSRPDESDAGAQPLPVAIVGRLSERSDVDTIAVDVPAAGTITVRAMANRVFASPVDLVLQICDRDGYVLAQNDDTRGLDPQVSLDVKRSGRLYVRVFGFPETPNSTIGFASGPDYIYVLTASMEPSVDYFLPLAAAESPPPHVVAVRGSGELVPRGRVLPATLVSPPTAVDTEDPLAWQWLPRLAEKRSEVAGEVKQIVASELPIVVSGVISHPGQSDQYAFLPHAGDEYQIEVWSARLGFELDPRVEVLDESGKPLATGDDTGRNDFQARVQFKTPDDHPLTIRLTDAVGTGGPRHAYAMVVRAAHPDFRLTLPGERIVVAPGKSVACKIEVQRRFGMDVPIEVTAEDLPAGVTYQTVESKPSGETAKEVELVLTCADSAAPFQGWIRITGRARADNAPARTATYPLRPAVDLQRLWLTVQDSK